MAKSDLSKQRPVPKREKPKRQEPQPRPSLAPTFSEAAALTEGLLHVGTSTGALISYDLQSGRIVRRASIFVSRPQPRWQDVGPPRLMVGSRHVLAFGSYNADWTEMLVVVHSRTGAQLWSQRFPQLRALSFARIWELPGSTESTPRFEVLVGSSFQGKCRNERIDSKGKVLKSIEWSAWCSQESSSGLGWQRRSRSTPKLGYFDLDRGAWTWSYETVGAVAGHAADDEFGLVAIGQRSKRTLQGISMKNGHPLWTSEVPGTGPVNLQVFGNTGLVYIAEMNTTLAVDVRSGKVLWQKPVRAILQARGGTLIAELRDTAADRENRPGADARIVRMDSTSGATQWTHVAPLGRFSTVPDRPLIFALQANRLTMLALEDGSTIWSVEPPRPVEAQP